MAEIKARPTLYKGIQMRSRLEADYAAEMDRWRVHWGYEPECFASNEGQWLPDFGYSFGGEPFDVFCEIKPAEPLLKQHIPGSIGFTQHVDTILKRMTIAWASRPDAGLELTFWRYGGPAYLTVICGGQGQAWVVDLIDRELPTLLWAGMGQVGKCRDRESEVRSA